MRDPIENIHDSTKFVERELRPYGLIDRYEIDELAPSGGTLPFINVVCKKR